MSLITQPQTPFFSFAFLTQALGTICLLCLILILLINLSKVFLRILPRNLLTRYGKDSWVVITGASDGIGRGFCEEFAKEGFNIVLVARNLEKLVKAQIELSDVNPKIQTRKICADFTKSSEPGFFDRISKELSDLDVSILVNNVGLGDAGAFDQISEEKLRDMIIVNTLPQAMLTRKLICSFKTRKNRSVIINVSAMVGARPLPYFAAYSATKGFNDFFSRALAGEYPDIDVISLRPGYVSTPMINKREPDFETLTPEECARGVIDKLGSEVATGGHWKHAFALFKLNLLPDWVFNKVARVAGRKLLESFVGREDKENGKKEQ